jgi:hypothetical protein
MYMYTPQRQRQRDWHPGLEADTKSDLNNEAAGGRGRERTWPGNWQALDWEPSDQELVTNWRRGGFEGGLLGSQHSGQGARAGQAARCARPLAGPLPSSPG